MHSEIAMTSPDTVKKELTSLLPEFKMDEDKHASWTNQLEIVTKNVGENAQGYKFMHIDSAKINFKYYNTLMYISIFFGPLAAVISGIGITLNPDAPTTFPIISSIIAFIAGLFTTIVKFGKYEQTASAHKLAASRYTSLESNVRRQLSLPRDVRVDAVSYIRWLNNSYDELFLSSPLISDKIVSNYTSKATKAGISIPTRQDVVININTEYENQRVSELVHNKSIPVNKEKSSTSIEEDAEEKVYIPEVTLRESPEQKEKKQTKPTSIKRTGSFIPFAELNQYSDGMMSYQMKRMMGFKQ